MASVKRKSTALIDSDSSDSGSDSVSKLSVYNQ